MADILKVKRGSASTIQRINPLLQEGEMVLEFTDDTTNHTANGSIKVGDGITRYNDLEPFIKAITDYIAQSEKGVAYGVVPLNGHGKVDAGFLPSYVDDILEFPTFDDFPNPGEDGKLYIDISQSSNNVYRWSGTQYVCVSASVTYSLAKNGTEIILNCSDGTFTKVTINQILQYANKESFPEAGDADTIYIDKSKTANNIYRWNPGSNEYIIIGGDTSYSISRTGHNIILTGSDGSTSSITELTYSLSKLGSTIKLTGSDGSSTTVTDANTTYSLSRAGHVVKITGSDGNTSGYTELTYSLSKSGSSVTLTGSDGSSSTVSNLGGVEIRSTDPSASELYAGKMWIKI